MRNEAGHLSLSGTPMKLCLLAALCLFKVATARNFGFFFFFFFDFVDQSGSELTAIHLPQSLEYQNSRF